MTKPSDFGPDEAIEIKNGSDPQRLNRQLWALRLAGAALLVAGWFIFTRHHPVGSPSFVSSSAIFATLGAYAFIAAAAARRVSVNLEKKLRLRLLVHNMELENMAMRDDLTRLFNRRYLFDRMERELQTAKGFDRPLAAIVIDLDSLKAINDTYGHRMGDKVLANFGQFLLEHSRATDVPARIGGDEFAIVLPDTSKRGACTMMERLSRALEKTDIIDEDGLTLRVSASLGMSGYPWGGDTVDTIMQEADTSMYAAKQARKRSSCLPGDDGASAEDAVPEMFAKAGDGRRASTRSKRPR